MKQVSAFALLAAFVLISGTVALAQAPATAPATYETVIVRSWKNVHNKILAMAKDTQYPDDKLGWKPHPDSRSVMDELRHVTIGLEVTTALPRVRSSISERARRPMPASRRRARRWWRRWRQPSPRHSHSLKRSPCRA